MDSEEFLDARKGPNDPKEVGFEFEISLVTKGDSTVVICFVLIECCRGMNFCICLLGGVFSAKNSLVGHNFICQVFVPSFPENFKKTMVSVGPSSLQVVQKAANGELYQCVSVYFL